MAKTTQEYFDLLKAELSSFPELVSLVSDVNNAQELLVKLTTDSPVANWDLMTWVQATGCAATDAEVQNTLKIILQEMPKRKYGSYAWYVDMAKKFQLGDVVVWNDGLFAYNPVNLSARIIAQAAAVPISQGVRLKVAKLAGSELGPISTPELDALTAYFNDQVIGIKPAGVHLVITTGIPDLLKMHIKIVRNPQVLADDGSLLTNSSVFPVEVAINNHIQYLPFNGELNMTALEDSIQVAEGVIDVEINTAYAKYGSFPYQLIGLAYKPDAGYMKIDPAIPLSSTIVYQLP